jgi:hypothetical protein
MNQLKEQYIGDGVYVSFDGYSIVLRTLRDTDCNHYIYLEPAVWSNLKDYVDRLSEIAYQDTDPN